MDFKVENRSHGNQLKYHYICSHFLQLNLYLELLLNPMDMYLSAINFDGRAQYIERKSNEHQKDMRNSKVK